MFNFKRILVTGGAGFIGSAFVRKMLIENECKIFNIDKLNYASDLVSILELKESKDKHIHYEIDLSDFIFL